MRPYLFRGLLALLVALVFSAPAAAQSVIRGKVVDAQGKPVEGASVTIEATESSRRAQVKTNRNGEFMQIGLPSGRYNVTAVKDNLKQMQTANISQGMPVELSFQLSPTSGLTPEQAKAQAETQAMAQQAIEAMRAGRDDEAIQKFNEIVTKIPTCSDCYYNLGVAYSKKQQFTGSGSRLHQGHGARSEQRRCAHGACQRLQRAEEVRPGAAGQRQGCAAGGSWRRRRKCAKPSTTRA